MEARGYTLKFLKALAHYSPDGTSNVANWEFAGSDHGAGLPYFQEKHPALITIPPHADQCICTHDIKENCYISCKLVPDLVLVVGNHCVRRIKEADRGRKCLGCGAPRGSRRGNWCKKCLRPKCRDCGNHFGHEDTIGMFCPACIDKHCTECARLKAPGRSRCTDCAKDCSDCGEPVDCYPYGQPLCDICRRSVWKVRFGKHKGSEFAVVRSRDFSYCQWVLREKPSGGTSFYWWLHGMKKREEGKDTKEKTTDSFW